MECVSLLMSKRKYLPVKAGQKVRLEWENTDYKMACCDCNLVHRMRFTLEGDTMVMQGWRDNRATAQLRRHRG